MKKAILLIGILGLVAAGCNFKTATNRNPTGQQGNNSSGNSNKPSTVDVPVQDSQHVQNTKRFTSNDLGVTFTYLAKPGDPNPHTQVLVEEKGNEIFVHYSDQAPEAGQTITVFQKDPSLDIKSAIEQQFLKGISPAQCYVKVYASTEFPESSSSDVFAGIGYPVDPNLQEPVSVPAACPAAYSETNGLRYFMMDKNHPDRFLFLNIGQYSLTSDGSPKDHAPNWSSSVEVLAK